MDDASHGSAVEDNRDLGYLSGDLHQGVGVVVVFVVVVVSVREAGNLSCEYRFDVVELELQ